MTLPDEGIRERAVERKIPSLRAGWFKTVFYIVILGVSLSIVDMMFGWTTVETIPPYLQHLSGIILLVNPYVQYIQAILIFCLGYLIVNALSGVMYTYMRRFTDHPTAATVRTLTRIAGLAVLLSLIASVFNANPAAALTVGSFGGLVVGFATQTILSNVVAGVFLLLSRPYTFGDTITVAGQTGVVKEIRLMHLVLESTDGTREILIPSGTVVTQIIHKMKPPMQVKPVKTVLKLETPPARVKIGSPLVFRGRLLEAETGKPIANAKIMIMERDVGRDDLLASGTTGEDGGFAIEWKARKTDLASDTAEVYAKFDGDEQYQRSRSELFVVKIERR
ncbi:MAG: mechanosensitive ion channel [Candidatus Brockarchaeota archaeon]|nr:mechanosensitive ion channel [Candidatus Brockarchaeota archaeon]